jgi:hypothetical protein
MADQITINCPTSTCQVDLKVSLSPFDLSIQDATTIGFSIALVWAVAYGFRVLIRLINHTTPSDNSGD